MINYLRLLIPRSRAQWSIGIYAGANPFALSAHPSTGRKPVLSRSSLEGVRASGVADPFMIRHGSQWLMFFEIEDSRSGKGEIGLASSDDALSWHFDGIVLQEPFHLSYPQVFEFGGSYYMLPESSAAGALRLYRASSFPRGWELCAELLQGNLADATLFRHADKWWLIALDGFRQGDSMVIYHADALEGPWRAHAANPISAGNRQTSRPAGNVIMHEGKLVRLAQDYESLYGRLVRAFYIEELTPETYAERPALGGRPLLGPGRDDWNAAGMHHMDAHELGPGEWIACVDGRKTVWTWPLLDRLAARIGRRRDGFEFQRDKQ